ncbi:hypothetical protein C8R47DRAFT_1082896 [Mycena vitilis]|nr:hypothetical protein C8R47DRAFT_1082896 [Mycena vitilis]
MGIQTLLAALFLCFTVQAATRHDTLLLPAQAVVISSAHNSHVALSTVPLGGYSTFGRVVCRPDGTVGISSSTTVHYILNDTETLLETGTDIYLCPGPVTKEELYCIYCSPGLKTHRITHKGAHVISGKPLSGKSNPTSSERWKITASGVYADSVFNVPLYLYQV